MRSCVVSGGVLGKIYWGTDRTWQGALGSDICAGAIDLDNWAGLGFTGSCVSDWTQQMFSNY